MRYTLKDVAAFAHAHEDRFTCSQWAHRIVAANRDDKLHILENADKLIGLCIANVFEKSKTVYIEDIVCIENGFQEFVRVVKERYPDYHVAGKRKGRIRKYTHRTLWAAHLHLQANQPKPC